MPVRNDHKIDFWVVGDTNGVLHAAQVHRFYNSNGEIDVVQLATACSPQIQLLRRVRDDRVWHGSELPAITLRNGIMITRYRIHDAPTCLLCHTMAVPR